MQYSLAATEEEIVADKPSDRDKDKESEVDESDSDKDTDSEEESNEDEENLGPEDGEEGCDDEYNALGYAAL